ncbi:coiled-coil domain-containing protein 43-like [Gigantopelta aegis]|uniref:coiled-coil domain-containing protein 43-like n=1 Tax=Gigantopelta aegis TaxID=1735272 RepID=UPI001B889E72|nr:coiled-coil domain-containing protein 43-like [Gigantopelta aegis]
MAASSSPYDLWLSDKLLSLNPDCDTDVFVSYISAILDETDTPIEEKKESLGSIIGEVVSQDQDAVCEELIQKWNEFQKQKKNSAEDNTADLGDKLSQILSERKLTVAKERQLTSEELARKEAILAQYSQVSDEEDASRPEESTKKTEAGGDSLVTKNVNKEAVLKAEKEKREKSKQEHEKKKEKDKKDRENQKQKVLDRKDGEKKRTQKGEKRR